MRNHSATLALLALFAAEVAVFAWAVSCRQAWVYPRWHDQVQYLQQAYDGYERMRLHGYAPAAWESLKAEAQGVLHVPLAMALFAAAGPSRGAALALNLLAFLALQGATFLAMRRASSSGALALMAAALLVSVRFPWTTAPGSAFDFRLDWMAACGFGTTLAAVVAADGFRSRPRSLLAGAAAGATILLRHITGVYLAGAAALLLGRLILRRGEGRARANLLLAGAVSAAMAGPVLWLNRRAIYDYYWISQVAGAERAARGTRLSALGSLRWLLEQTLLNQVGWGALAVAAGTLGVLWALAARPGRGEDPGPRAGDALAASAAFLAAPAAVLALHPVKDAHHLSALITPIAWLVALAWERPWRRVSGTGRPWVAASVCILAAAVLARTEAADGQSAAVTAGLRSVNALGDYLLYRSEECGLKRPAVAVTSVEAGIDGGTLRVMGYERHGCLAGFLTTLPTGILRPSREVVLRQLAGSDFVCLASAGPPRVPFDEAMLELMPEMRAWCASHLRRVGEIGIPGGRLELFERGELGAGAARFDAIVDAAMRGPPGRPTGPPAAPKWVSAPGVLASTLADFRFDAWAAYSPVTYGAGGLPAGIRLDPATGTLAGRFQAPGDYAIGLVASNVLGSTHSVLEVHVEDQPRYVVLRAPPSCRVNAPVAITYGAFDGAGKIDFVEITDLTERRTLCRIEATAAERERLLGTYSVSFATPGPRDILTRTARFDPARSAPYSFTDTSCRIEVRP